MIISTSAQLIALLDEEGRLTQPVTLAPGCELSGLTGVTSLAGVTLAPGCWLYDLTSVTSLSGVTLAPDCRLYGLTAVTSLAGVTLARGCWLSGLTGVLVPPLDTPVVPDLDAQILARVAADPDCLNMADWHCGTTHCRAGHAIDLAGVAGYALQAQIGPEAAGACLYAASYPGRPLPNFFATTTDTLADLRRIR